MKDWFKARNIWGAAITSLSDEEAGRLAKALWAYTMNGEIVDLPGAEKGIFAIIQMTLSQDEEQMLEISKKRAEAGALGGKQRVANQANASDDQANQANACNKNKNKNKDIRIQNKEEDNITPLKRFKPPTRDEVSMYCLERKNHVNPDRFIDFYTANGWRVGKNPMKDWKATVRTWEKSAITEEQYRQDREYSELPY